MPSALSGDATGGHHEETYALSDRALTPHHHTLYSAGAALRSAGQPEPPPVFTEAENFLELNDTDGDLGIHASIDGGPWTLLEIEGPHERSLLEIVSRGRLRSQGLTQLSFESAEPAFDELPPQDFLRRFPEGRYAIEARSQSGDTFQAAAMLSHVLAAPPQILVSGVVGGGRLRGRRSAGQHSGRHRLGSGDHVASGDREVRAGSDQPLPALSSAKASS